MGIPWDWARGGHIEGSARSGELLDRGSVRFSQYSAKGKGRYRNGYRFPRSQSAPEADVNYGGGPLRGLL